MPPCCARRKCLVVAVVVVGGNHYCMSELVSSSRGRRRQRGAAGERAIPERYDAPPRHGWSLRGKGKRLGASRRSGRARRGYSGSGAAAGMARRKQKNLNRKRWPRRKTDTWRRGDRDNGGGGVAWR
eukprot:scaffold8224_cov118-Isochrysis_galbana.AAC.15